MWRVRYESDASIGWTQSPPELHQRTWLMQSVDFISEIERSRLLGYPINRGGDTWTHLDTTTEIGWQKWRYREIVAHDHRAIMAHDHRAILSVDWSSPNQAAHIFTQKSLINIDVLLFKLKSWLIVKQLSNFEGISWVHHDSPAF